MNKTEIPGKALSDLSNSDTLIGTCYPLVRWIAKSTVARLPTTIPLDDLVQVGIVGLMEAAKNFDESKGASFQTYAGIRIRGYILDEIRRNDWLPRSVYRRIRLISTASREIANQTGRAAKAIEVAEKLGISLEEYHQVLFDSKNNYMFDYDAVGDFHTGQRQVNSFFINPLLDAESADSRRLLNDAFKKLNEREQKVLSMYYYEELNLKEIAKLFSVTESRICQIHVKAVSKLRGYLNA